MIVDTQRERPAHRKPAAGSRTQAAKEHRPAQPVRDCDEFLDWLPENVKVEWTGRRLVFHSPIGEVHDDLSGFLYSILRCFVETYQRGRIFGETFVMRLDPKDSARMPDVMFVATEHLNLLHTNYLNGPADLAVEVISPGSRTRDRRDKLREYAAGGVREYWILDPARRQAEFYTLGKRGAHTAGTYQPIPIAEDGMFRSVVLPGLAIRLTWLWDRPAVTAVLRELRLV